MNQQNTKVLTVNKTSMLRFTCHTFHEWSMTTVAVNKRCEAFYSFCPLNLTSETVLSSL